MRARNGTHIKRPILRLSCIRLCSPICCLARITKALSKHRNYLYEALSRRSLNAQVNGMCILLYYEMCVTEVHYTAMIYCKKAWL